MFQSICVDRHAGSQNACPLFKATLLEFLKLQHNNFKKVLNYCIWRQKKKKTLYLNIRQYELKTKKRKWVEEKKRTKRKEENKFKLLVFKY